MHVFLVVLASLQDLTPTLITLIPSRLRALASQGYSFVNIFSART